MASPPTSPPLPGRPVPAYWDVSHRVPQRTGRAVFPGWLPRPRAWLRKYPNDPCLVASRSLTNNDPEPVRHDAVSYNWLGNVGNIPARTVVAVLAEQPGFRGRFARSYQ